MSEAQVADNKKAADASPAADKPAETPATDTASASTKLLDSCTDNKAEASSTAASTDTNGTTPTVAEDHVETLLRGDQPKDGADDDQTSSCQKDYLDSLKQGVKPAEAANTANLHQLDLKEEEVSALPKDAKEITGNEQFKVFEGPDGKRYFQKGNGPYTVLERSADGKRYEGTTDHGNNKVVMGAESDAAVRVMDQKGKEVEAFEKGNAFSRGWSAFTGAVSDTFGAVASVANDYVIQPVADAFTSFFDDDSTWSFAAETPGSCSVDDLSCLAGDEQWSWVSELSGPTAGDDFFMNDDYFLNEEQWNNWDFSDTSGGDVTLASRGDREIEKRADGSVVLIKDGSEQKLTDNGDGTYSLGDRIKYDSNTDKLTFSRDGRTRTIDTPDEKVPLTLPPDAREAGTVKGHDGKEYTIHKVPGNEGESYLTDNTGKVIAKQGADGYEFKIQSNGEEQSMKMKIGRGADGKFVLESMERFDKDGRPVEKFENNQLTRFTPDGRPVMTPSGTMSEEQLKEYRNNLPPGAVAVVKVGEGDNAETRLLERLENGVVRERKLGQDQGKADRERFFAHGLEILRENGKLAVRDASGRVVPLTSDYLRNHGIKADMLALIQQAVDRRDQNAPAITTNSDGTTSVTTADEGRDPATDPDRIEVKVDTDKPAAPIVIIDHGRNETVTQHPDGRIEEKNTTTGEKIWGFNPDEGFTSKDFRATDEGLEYLPAGIFMESDGDVHGDGWHISANAVEIQRQEYERSEAVGDAEISKASGLIAPAYGVIYGAFDPATAQSLCTAAYSGLSSAINLAMSVGNTAMAGELMSKQAEASHWIGLSSAARKATSDQESRMPGGGGGASFMMAEAARNAASGVSPVTAFEKILARMDPTNPRVAHLNPQVSLTVTDSRDRTQVA